MIELIWKALKRDIDRQTWSIAKISIEDNLPEKRDDVQTDDSPTSLRMVLRWGEEAIAMLLHVMKDKWTRKDDDGVYSDGADDKLDTSVLKWQFVRRDGTDDSETSDTPGITVDNRSWAMMMHRFVVKYVMWQWVKTFFPAKENSYASEFVSAKSDIDEQLYSLSMPIKKKRAKNLSQVKIILEEG